VYSIVCQASVSSASLAMADLTFLSSRTVIDTSAPARSAAATTAWP
jgi:hypothetical protein